jgi:hypothetical protein
MFCEAWRSSLARAYHPRGGARRVLPTLLERRGETLDAQQAPPGPHARMRLSPARRRLFRRNTAEKQATGRRQAGDRQARAPFAVAVARREAATPTGLVRSQKSSSKPRADPGAARSRARPGTAVVPAHRRGAVPDSHRVPSYLHESGGPRNQPRGTPYIGGSRNGSTTCRVASSVATSVRGSVRDLPVLSFVSLRLDITRCTFSDIQELGANDGSG